MSHTVELIAVGTELLLGNVVNSDAQLLSQDLSCLGLNVYHHTVVGDNPQRLRRVVEQARERADIIITTGGLGPTCDDLTKNVLAEAFGKKLVFHDESARSIRDFFNRMGWNMSPNNLSQAYLPEGCTVLRNDWGTAPGCAFEAMGKHVIMLPGPPSECIPMFRTWGVPYLEKLSDGVIASRTLRVFGIGEAAAEQLLRNEMNALTNPTLAPYAKTGEMELRITAKAATREEARRMMDPVEEKVRQVLGDKIYGVDVPSLEAAIIDLLRDKGLTLGSAESCTGGLIAKRLTDVPGSSDIFVGTVVSYANQVKEKVLGVPGNLLEILGPVCAPVAECMAVGARNALGCDIAVATTGLAGPGGDDRGNPEGLVYVALATAERTYVRKFRLGRGRDRVRVMAASYALDMVRRVINGLPLLGEE